MTTPMPTERYTIPVDRVLVGILTEVMPGVRIRTSMDTKGVDHLPAIYFRKNGGSSVGNSPSGRQTACSWGVDFDCLHDSKVNAELLADWLYSELEKLVDPNIPGHNPVTHEDCWITAVEESELPNRNNSALLGGVNLTLVQVSFVLTFRRQQ